MSIKVNRSIGIQVIVTETFKQELKAELQEASEEVQRRSDQMELQSRRFLAEVQRTDLTQAMSARKRIEAERRRHDAMKEDIQRQIEEVDKLELESEYPRGALESTVEISEGDDIVKKLTVSQIVVKDGIVVEIREV
jgi:hypothetical protein